ncbi:MAG: hypothetical protein AAFX56_01450 [Pseudomonadota bacterium]
MQRILLVFLCLIGSSAFAQTTRLAFDNTNFVVTPAFNNVPLFSFDVEIDRPLAPGVYDNPALVSVSYTVTGELNNTPSGFPAFELRREISGAEFYAQGSSLRFEVAANAVLTDGVQAIELAGADVVFRFNGREVDNGRFHPALLELSANGTGRIQNSDNIVSNDPFQQVGFGEEYITDLQFDPGNLTLLTEINVPPPADPPVFGGSGSLSLLGLLALLSIAMGKRLRSASRRMLS